MDGGFVASGRVMIVRQFLQWVRNAPPGERAEATSALARAYLHSDLSPDDLAAAEGAMIMLLDDPSPLVRRALAEVFASSQKAPLVVVHALAADQPDVAMPVLARSPLLLEDDLVDLIATGQPETQIAIAGRALLSRSLAAAIAEVGSAEACLTLLENPDADIALFSIDRIVERFGHLAAIRENLLARDDLPMATRQALLSKLSQTLAGFVTARQWLGPEHAEYAAREACEKATVALAAETPYDEVAALMQHLAPERPAHRRHDPARVAVRQCRAVRGGAGGIVRRAARPRHQLYPRQEYLRLPRALPQGRPAGRRLSGVPRSDRGDARRHSGRRAGRGGAAQARAWSSACWRVARSERGPEMASLLALLRRFAVEAAREEARMFCDDLVADDYA